MELHWLADFALHSILTTTIVLLLLPAYTYCCKNQGAFYNIMAFVFGIALYVAYRAVAGEINYYAVPVGIIGGLWVYDQIQIWRLRSEYPQ